MRDSLPSAPRSSGATGSGRRTVATRILLSYALLLLAFVITIGWSALALRRAAHEAELLRAGYAPVQLRIGEALAAQNVLAAQLNHITAARNPADVQDWLETARRARPQTYAQLRAAAKELEAIEEQEGLGGKLAIEIGEVESLLEGNAELFAQLFRALDVGEDEAADRIRNDLVKREAEGASRLRAMKTSVEQQMQLLRDSARQRESRALWILVAVGALTLTIGVATTLYARRVLRPLTLVTQRAKAVASGDFTPRPAVSDRSEIGELAATFEKMVAAIQRARADLVQAERLATIGKMAAHITHEIRNPLSSMGLNIELMEEEIASSELNEEAVQLLNAIKKEAARLSRIAEQYLSIARRPRPELERESVRDVVEDILRFVRPELTRSSIALETHYDDDLPEAQLDEGQFRQAMLNLVRNAREAMKDGGTLVVGVKKAVGGGVEVYVDDTGPGIPEDKRASIFDPFFTTKARGTGLGLAVTRDIIEAHAGAIACESAPQGSGTRFLIYLPDAGPNE